VQERNSQGLGLQDGRVVGHLDRDSHRVNTGNRLGIAIDLELHITCRVYGASLHPGVTESISLGPAVGRRTAVGCTTCVLVVRLVEDCVVWSWAQQLNSSIRPGSLLRDRGHEARILER